MHAANAARLMPNSELHSLTTGDRDVDITPPEEWIARAPAIAKIFADFLARNAPARQPAMRAALNNWPCPALCGIHVLCTRLNQTWMAGTSGG